MQNKFERLLENSDTLNKILINSSKLIFYFSSSTVKILYPSLYIQRKSGFINSSTITHDETGARFEKGSIAPTMLVNIPTTAHLSFLPSFNQQPYNPLFLFISIERITMNVCTHCVHLCVYEIHTYIRIFVYKWRDESRRRGRVELSVSAH